MSRLAIATGACFTFGAGLLVPFEYALTLTAGVLLLVAAVVCGVFLVVSPEALAREEDQD